jgi:hypothetical protein
MYGVKRKSIRIKLIEYDTQTRMPNGGGTPNNKFPPFMHVCRYIDHTQNPFHGMVRPMYLVEETSIYKVK